ncbi:MAG: PhoH family protein [Deltaproteobacteria bacterium]|nr:PhoH family protein [Deltaproteobacteria bacterium]MBN2674675.1 PhoH family protein [Deltaproteobacteria bacterium]
MDTTQLETAYIDSKILELVEEYTFSNHDLMLKVLGPGSEFVHPISRQLGVKIGLRGDTLLFRGDPEGVSCAIRLVDQLARVCRGGKTLKEADVVRGARILADDPHAELNAIFNDVVHVTASRRLITPKGLAQKKYVDTIRNKDLTFGIGPAGTGKTYLAVAVAVSELLAGRYKRIVLTRPAVEAGEKLGFLPGDMVEKINPYVRPLYDALNDMMDSGRTQDLIALGQIEIAPLAFMRGRTLNDSFVILDEAQNTTRAQMKMFLTRLGYSSKAVVTGDATQVDLPGNTTSGLVDAKRVLGNIEGIGFCQFSDVDVVRHELVQRIILAYEKAETLTARAQSDRKMNDGEHQSD